MKVILAAIAGAAITAAGTALAGPTSKPVTQAQIAALTKRVAALERRDVQYDCIVKVTNGQAYEPYTITTAGGFDTKSGNLDVFTSPDPADPEHTPAAGYLVASDTQFPQC